MTPAPTAPTVTRQTAAHRPGRSWPHALPALTRHVTRTTPWATLLAGCLTATVVLALLRYAAPRSHTFVDQNTMRFTVLPAVVALAFVPRTPFRPVVDATPVPAWVTSAGQTLLAVPALALTCWVQLLLIRHHTPPGVISHPPAVYPLLAQITGWCTLTVAVAACCDRSRYARPRRGPRRARQPRAHRARDVLPQGQSPAGNPTRQPARRDRGLVHHRRCCARPHLRRHARPMAPLHPHPRQTALP